MPRKYLPLSIEHKQKISDALKGRKKPPFSKSHRINIGLSGLGRTPWNKGKKVKQCGENHPNWKGGRQKHSGGYVMIYAPNHPAGIKNFILEHRFLMENKLGRYLQHKEIVHHINGIRNDYRIKNLILMTEKEHKRLHMREKYACQC